jgi:hypothetical protein
MGHLGPKLRQRGQPYDRIQCTRQFVKIKQIRQNSNAGSFLCNKSTKLHLHPSSRGRHHTLYGVRTLICFDDKHHKQHEHLEDAVCPDGGCYLNVEVVHCCACVYLSLA